MYLSRFFLNGRNRQARNWLSDCHALHRMIMAGFPSANSDATRAALGVLYRVEPATNPPDVTVLVQSAVEPDWIPDTDAVTAIDRPRSLGPLLDSLYAGGRYRFRLRANPSRRVHRRAALQSDARSLRAQPEPGSAIGKRVELTREVDQIAWLERKADAAGFSIVRSPLGPDSVVSTLRLSAGGKLNGERRGDRLTLGTVLFEGVLEVIDQYRLRETVINGVGPGKAFGCGLLSLAPVPALST